MTDTSACRADILYFGTLAAGGVLSREDAALRLVSSTGLRVREARQAIDTWQAYRTPTPPPSAPAARRAFLDRLFTRNRRNPKETSTP